MSNFAAGDKVRYVDSVGTYTYSYNGTKEATVQAVVNADSVLIVYPKNTSMSYMKDYGILVNPSRLRKVADFTDGIYKLPGYSHLYYVQKKGDDLEYTHTVDLETGKMTPLVSGPITMSRNVTNKLVKYDLVKGEEITVEAKPSMSWSLTPAYQRLFG